MIMPATKRARKGRNKRVATNRSKITPDEVREYRRELGILGGGSDMSQQDFAQLVGVSLMTVSRWERGVYAPSPTSIKLIKQELRTAQSRAQMRANKLLTTEAVPV